MAPAMFPAPGMLMLLVMTSFLFLSSLIVLCLSVVPGRARWDDMCCAASSAVQGTAWLTLITGGDFGPEGSVLAVGLGVRVTAAFMWSAYRRGHVIPLRRQARVNMAAALVH